MSVMSAAEARQGAGISPDIPSQPLRIVRPADGQDDPPVTGTLLDSGDDTPAGSGAAGSGAAERSESTLRVTQVRMVREVRVRTLRAEGARAGSVPRPRGAAPAGAPARAGAPAPARSPVPAGAPARARTVAAPAPARTMTAATAASRLTSQVRVARQARVTGHAGVADQRRAARRPGPVRLTRRGRRLVAGLVIAVVIVAATVLWMSAAGSVQASSHGSPSPYQGMTQVVVQPGQTLWSIAAAAEPSGNSWAVVQQIMNVNALSSASVQAGQLLWVPRT